MAIVAGFDVHRAQITFDALDDKTGEIHRGRIDATPDAVRGWAERFAGEDIDVAVEACTGWLFVCQALAEVGAVPHLAEPVETSALRGKKRRAKTDVRTPGGCGRCSAKGGCRRRGSHRRTCWSGAPARGCARRWSTNARPGCSESKQRSFTTASPAPRTGC